MTRPRGLRNSVAVALPPAVPPPAARPGRRPAADSIELVVEHMAQNLEPLKYSILAPSRYLVYLHADEFARLEGILGIIQQQTIRALNEKLADLNLGSGLSRYAPRFFRGQCAAGGEPGRLARGVPGRRRRRPRARRRAHHLGAAAASQPRAGVGSRTKRIATVYTGARSTTREMPDAWRPTRPRWPRRRRPRPPRCRCWQRVRLAPGPSPPGPPAPGPSAPVPTAPLPPLPAAVAPAPRADARAGASLVRRRRRHARVRRGQGLGVDRPRRRRRIRSTFASCRRRTCRASTRASATTPRPAASASSISARSAPPWMASRCRAGTTRSTAASARTASRSRCRMRARIGLANVVFLDFRVERLTDDAAAPGAGSFCWRRWRPPRRWRSGPEGRRDDRGHGRGARLPGRWRHRPGPACATPTRIASTSTSARGIFMVIDGVGGQAAGGEAADARAVDAPRAARARDRAGGRARARGDRGRQQRDPSRRRVAARLERHGVRAHGGRASRTAWRRSGTSATRGSTRSATAASRRSRAIIRRSASARTPASCRRSEAMRHPRRNEVYRDVGSELARPRRRGLRRHRRRCPWSPTRRCCSAATG